MVKTTIEVQLVSIAVVTIVASNRHAANALSLATLVALRQLLTSCTRTITTDTCATIIIRNETGTNATLSTTARTL